MGTSVLYNNNQYELYEDENVLDCLLRNGQDIPHSCRVGVCQACIMKSVDGKIATRAQHGLKDSFIKQNFFLSCQYYPETDISIQLPSEASLSVKAMISEINYFSKSVVCVRLVPDCVFEYNAGQYIALSNGGPIIRSYSIANRLIKDGYIELHVRLIPNGKMSTWLAEHAKIGDEVVIRGPAGDCFYIVGENNSYPLLLAGTGTGLAPLYGILMDALEQGHQGEINLYHGALCEEDLYFVDELTKIAESHDNFHYIPCVLNGYEGSFYRVGNLEDIVLNKIREKVKDVRLYLCGVPELVNSIKTKAFLSGVSPKRMYSDAFFPGKDNERVAKERRSTDRPAN